MAGGSSGSNAAATLNIILGVFLKLLALFVVMVSYTDLQPIKVRQAEASLSQQFGITVPLAKILSGPDDKKLNAVTTGGYSYTELGKELQTQFDFLSSQKNAEGDALVLVVPADLVFPVGEQLPRSPDFVPQFLDVLTRHGGKNTVYTIDIKANGTDAASTMRNVSNLVQDFVGNGYNQDLLTIQVDPNNKDTTVEFQLQAQVRT